jgi:hypothetical protein
MASKLVGVRLPDPAYRRLQRIKRARRVEGDAEAIRLLIEEYPLGASLADMAVFAPPRTKAERRARNPSRRVDDLAYGA